MTGNPLSFLDQEGVDLAEPMPEPAQAEPAPEPAETAPQGEIAAPPAAQVEDARHIPISALLDEREKRQAKEREAEELRRKLAEYEARLRPQQPVPDVLTDPDQWQSHQTAQMQLTILNERLNTSEELARDKFGDETVDRATEAFTAAVQQNPALYNEMKAQRHPYRYVVEWHKKQALLQRVGPDPDAWLNAEVERRLAERLVAAAPAQSVQPRTSAPPRSLAAAPAVAGASGVKPGFDALFGG